MDYPSKAKKERSKNTNKRGSSNIEMGKKRYENIIFSFSYAIISMQVVY